MLQEEVELRKMLPEVFYDSNGFCTDRFRNSGRFCKKIALQEINIQFQYLQSSAGVSRPSAMIFMPL